jgi:hypothetical protein
MVRANSKDLVKFSKEYFERMTQDHLNMKRLNSLKVIVKINISHARHVRGCFGQVFLGCFGTHAAKLAASGSLTFVAVSNACHRLFVIFKDSRTFLDLQYLEVQNFQLLKTVDFDHGRTGSVSYFLRFLCTDQADCDFNSDPD